MGKKELSQDELMKILSKLQPKAKELKVFLWMNYCSKR